MRRIRFPCLVAAAIVCCGCLNSSTLIRVKPDGSGTITQTLLLNAAALKSLMSGLGSQSQAKAGNPFNEDELKRAAERMGKGVSLVSATPISANGFEGTRALFAFEDINQIRVDQDPNVGAGPMGTKSGTPARSPVSFKFARQATSSVLTITFDEKPVKETPTPAAAPAPEIDPAMMQMMKTMFQGFKIAIDLEVEGKIVKTNADYVEGSRITLMEIDMAGVLESEATLRALQTKAGPGASLAEIKPLLKDVKGVKINHPVVTVEYR